MRDSIPQSQNRPQNAAGPPDPAPRPPLPDPPGRPSALTLNSSDHPIQPPSKSREAQMLPQLDDSR